MGETADVIIIGAGVQGASLAFHLAERAVLVTVVDKATVAAGATGRSSGLVRMHYDLLAETRLAWASFPYFTDFATRVGGDCGFRRTGFLWIEGVDGAERVRANVAAHRALGIDKEVVTAEEILRLAPGLAVDGDEIAAYEPASGYADPAATAAAFLDAARARGARLVQGASVTAIDVAGERVTGVETVKGRISGPVVVNAGGCWAGRVAALAGLDVPIDVWRHDTAFLRVPDVVARPLPVVIDNARSMYLRPEGTELVLIGLEDHNGIGGSPDRDTAHPEPDFADRVVDRIVERIPGMIDGEFHSAHSGQDGLTPDQRPILGQAGPDGFYLDCGHSGTGFKTAPAVGLAMSELILDGEATSVDIAPFALERFVQGRLLEGEHGGAMAWR